MAELPYQTWQRVTGKSWSEASKGGFTSGSASANLALQSKLNSGWNPYAAPAPAPSAPAAAPAANNQPLIDFANQQRAETEALLNRQKGEQEGLFTNYENIRKNQEALPALYNRLQNEAGIPGLSQTAQGFKDEIYKVKDRLDRLGEDVVARTTGTLTTDAQRRRLQAAEAEPLQTNLARLGTGLAPVADMLSSAQANLSTQMGLHTQQQERDLEPIKLRINAISDRFAREITGFTQNKETQLTAILDKLERDRFLADRDWNLAQQLAAEERDFARQKKLASMQLSGLVPAGGGQQTSNSSTANRADYSTWSSGGVTGGNTSQRITGVVNAPSNNARIRISGVTAAPSVNQRISGVTVARPTSNIRIR